LPASQAARTERVPEERGRRNACRAHGHHPKPAAQPQNTEPACPGAFRTRCCLVAHREPQSYGRSCSRASVRPLRPFLRVEAKTRLSTPVRSTTSTSGCEAEGRLRGRRTPPVRRRQGPRVGFASRRGDSVHVPRRHGWQCLDTVASSSRAGTAGSALTLWHARRSLKRGCAQYRAMDPVSAVAASAAGGALPPTLPDILLAAAVERGRAAAVALRSYKGGGLARGDRSASFLDGAAGEWGKPRHARENS
jgi:hypothetical protein